jgi:N-acetylglucosamine-6-phosphate deacetylase
MEPIKIHCARLFDGWGLSPDKQLSIENGRISQLKSSPHEAGGICIPEAYLVSPGLVDIQVNGGGGTLFNDNPSVDGISRLALAHALFGTTALLPTLITDDLEKTDLAIASVRSCIEKGMSNIVGIHLEGPFLSPQRQGIHQSKFMSQSLDIQQLSALGKSGKTLVTLAPERVSAQDIKALTESGVLVFAGHTDCDDDTFAVAVEAGLCGVTHLFNAMSQLGPRQAGVAGATLLNNQLWAGIILDGHHVGQQSFEFVKRLNRLETTVLVSDAMPPAGCNITQFTLQGQAIHVREGRCVNDQGVLAGASITLSDGVRIAVEMYGLSIEQALASASRIPASLLGISSQKGVLQHGADADLVVWDAHHRVAGVMLSGEFIYLRKELRALLCGGTR